MPLIRGGIEAAPQTLIPPTQHGVDEDSKGSSKEQIQLVEKTQRLLHGPLKHVRAAALAAALLPLASVAVSPASAQTSCPSGGAVITGFVWNDVNNNGIQDAGEPWIAGVSVSLGTATTSTDANGFYSLIYTGAGACELAVQIPNGGSPSPTNAGTDDAVDSDGARDIVTGANSVVLITVRSDGTIITDPRCSVHSSLPSSTWPSAPTRVALRARSC